MANGFDFYSPENDFLVPERSSRWVGRSRRAVVAGVASVLPVRKAASAPLREDNPHLRPRAASEPCPRAVVSPGHVACLPFHLHCLGQSELPAHVNRSSVSSGGTFRRGKQQRSAQSLWSAGCPQALSLREGQSPPCSWLPWWPQWSSAPSSGWRLDVAVGYLRREGSGSCLGDGAITINGNKVAFQLSGCFIHVCRGCYCEDQDV